MSRMGSAGDQATRCWRVMYVCTLLVFNFVLYSCASVTSAAAPEPTIQPTDENNPIKVSISNPNIETAIVRVVGTSYMDDPDNNELSVPTCFNGQIISVWAPRYYLQTIQCNGISPQEYNFTLQPIVTNNTIDYSWLPALSNCQGCHAQPSGHDVAAEWDHSSHAGKSKDRYFESMYKGNNIRTGAVGRQTEWTISSNGRVRVRPANTNSPDYTGGGFRLDYPNEYGNCAYCHVPAAVEPQQTDVNLSSYSPAAGTIGESVTCDICHKVVGVTLDDNGYPYSDQPGILSFHYPSFPSGDTQISFGPLPYATTQNLPAHRISCFSIYSESSFCAACHYGKFNDMLIYGSYDEWKKSAYGMREVLSEGDRKKENPNYRSCQDCHMLSTEQINNNPLPSQRDACSATNENIETFNHDMLNRNGQSLIINAAALSVRLKRDEGTKSVQVTATVINTKAGHKFPTDSPLRHLILVVSATDEQDNPLPQIDGERIPIWGGVGIASDLTGMTNYGGLAGTIFANLLTDVDTSVSPTAAYWNPTKFAMVNTANGTTSDTRIEPNEAREGSYSFTLPARGKVKLTVRLIYRYAFIELAYQKGWKRPDIEVVAWDCTINAAKPETWICP